MIKNFNLSVVLLFLFTLALHPLINAQEQKSQILIGLTLGPSIPIGNFADNSSNNKKAEFASTSYGISDILFDFEFIFKNSNFGLSATYISQGYETDRDILESSLDFSVITMGPIYSIDLSNSFKIDLKCQVGYITSLYFLKGIHNSLDGDGFGIDLRSLLRFQISKRWLLIGQFGYFYSGQKFKNVDNFHIQALNVGLGVGLKFR